MKREVELSVPRIELADNSKLDELRRLIGGKLDKIFAIDPEPMILLSTNLLDKGDIRNGEQSWVAGWYQIWMTERQFVNEFAPILINGPGYRGHLSNAEWMEPVTTVLWAGIDSKSGTPSAIIYVRPDAIDVKRTVRIGTVLGSIARELNQSLYFNCHIDETTLQIVKFVDEELTGLDLVRKQGTKAAGVKEAITLNSGKEKPMLQFETMEQVLAHPDVRKAIDARVEDYVKSPDKVKAITLAAPIEVVKQREDVKPYFERLTREEVVKSLTEAEIEVALSGNVELQKKAMTVCMALSEKVKKFREEAKKILEAEGLPENAVTVTLANHDFAHLDPARVKAVALSVKAGLGITGNPGETQNKETGPEMTFNKMPSTFTKDRSNW